MILSLILFLIGIFCFLNRKNKILILILTEIMLLFLVISTTRSSGYDNIIIYMLNVYANKLYLAVLVLSLLVVIIGFYVSSIKSDGGGILSHLTNAHTFSSWFSLFGCLSYFRLNKVSNNNKIFYHSNDNNRNSSSYNKFYHSLFNDGLNISMLHAYFNSNSFKKRYLSNYKLYKGYSLPTLMMDSLLYKGLSLRDAKFVVNSYLIWLNIKYPCKKNTVVSGLNSKNSILNKFIIKRSFSTTIRRSNESMYKADINTQSNNIKYLHDQKLPKETKWVSNRPIAAKLGKIGDIDGFDYTLISLEKLYSFNENLSILNSIIKNMSPLNSYALAFVVRSVHDNSVHTLDRHFLVNNTTDAKRLLEIAYNKIDSLTTKYNFHIEDVISVKYRSLHYKVKDMPFSGGRIKSTPNLPTNTKLNIKSRLLSSDYIPHTMDLKYYGYNIGKKDGLLYFDYDKYIIQVRVVEENKEHILELKEKKGLRTLATVVDLSFGNGFIREFVGSNSITAQYNNKHELVNLEYEVPVSYIDSLKAEKAYDNKLLTFDIETYLDEKGNSCPYACGFYDGEKEYTYYLTDFKNSDAMLLKCLEDMLSPKYHKYTVYCHNLGNFDSQFIFKLCSMHFDIGKHVTKNGKIISMSITSRNAVNKKKTSIKINDSISILPSSLDALGIAFDVETRKGKFPYKFVRASNLNYVGEIPHYNYYEQHSVSVELYNNIKAHTTRWSVRDETILYLKDDLLCLHQIISKMSKIIFDKYKINITKHTTISGLALAIYRTQYLKPDSRLGRMKGSLESAIRSAYYGGRTEVFIPYGELIQEYDFNGLYPYGMLLPMPVGQPVFSLTKDLHKIFGFVKATVTAPALSIPVLPCRVYIDGEEKLVFPIGSWTGWFFSEELKLAQQQGYNINIHESYIFEKGYPFKEYVDEMSSIKDRSTGAMREIHKLLLNTLYGRMGMKDTPDGIKIVSSELAEQIHLTHNVIDNFPIGDNKEFIRYHKLPDEELCSQSGIDFESEFLKSDNTTIVNSSTAIAAATASWARIIMYPYIIKSLYTDTDSLFLYNRLNPSNLGKTIGKFKLVHDSITRAIFPSPKLYFLELSDSEIISKNKGYSGKLNKFQFMKLYQEGSINITDRRWRRNLEQGTVNISNQTMELNPKFTKRQKLYSLGKWVSTSPICVNSAGYVISTALVLKIDK